MKRAKTGRPSKLTPEIQDRICTAIRAGNYAETAAAYAGIHKDTFYTWLKRGRNEARGPYRAFSDAVEKALADAEARDVAIIGKAAESQWQAAAWRLERRHPTRWGRQDRVTHEGNPEKPIHVVEELRQKFAEALGEDERA